MTTLHYQPASTRPDLLAAPVAAAVGAWSGSTPASAIRVAEIDPTLADTAAEARRSPPWPASSSRPPGPM